MNKLILLTLISIFACSPPPKEDIIATPDILINIDKEFSDMSKQNGMSEAFIFFADPEVVKLGQGSHPIVGKTKLTEFYSSIDDSQMELTWEPLKAEIAASGELGYTYGKYFFTTVDSVELTSIGYYVSIWKKQKDGNWKFVLDGGAEGPVE
jgi:ketosteroid isomerase-like protein